MRKVPNGINKYYVRSYANEVFLLNWENGVWYVKNMRSSKFRGSKIGPLRLSARNILKGIAF